MSYIFAFHSFCCIYVSVSVLVAGVLASQSQTMAKEDTNKSAAAVDYPREKLPQNLQKIVDRQDDWMDDLYEGS